MLSLIKQFKSINHRALLLFTLVASQNNFASVSVITTTDSVNASRFLLFPLTISQCDPSGICTAIDGYWTSEAWPSLQVGQKVNLKVSDLNDAGAHFGFSLGNQLSGLYSVSLISLLQSGTAIVDDELKTAIYDRTDFLGISQAGILQFDASANREYFVFLSGVMQNDKVYEMKVSSIPLPAGFGLFLFGLIACWPICNKAEYCLRYDNVS
jgi:hypothetical protein